MTDQNITVVLDKDEWYPVYSVVDATATYGFTVTIPAALAARAKAAEEEFNAVQDQLHQIVKGRAL